MNKITLLLFSIFLLHTDTGAVISNQDQDGIDQGNLSLTTNSLDIQDLKDTDQSKTKGGGINISGNGDNLELSNTYASKDKQGTSRATIGKGSITVKDEQDQEQLAMLNRDLDKSQETTRDWETERVDTTLKIDTRVFSKEGRARIAEDFKNSWEGIQNLSEKTRQVIQQVAKLLEKNPVEITEEEIADTKNQIHQSILEDKNLNANEKQIGKELLENVFDGVQLSKDVNSLISEGLSPQEAEEKIFTSRIKELSLRNQVACAGACMAALLITVRISYTVYKAVKVAYQAKKVARLVEAGSKLDRNGLTRAGRALQKHGDREGSVFPRLTGNAANRNEQGKRILEEILKSNN